MTYSKAWKVVYILWPPVLRLLEKLRFHRGRQDFLLGHTKRNVKEIRNYLIKQGFEDGILAWKDDGEVLNMRKVDKKIFQYHIRVFNDGEIKGHHEYSPESNPWRHCFEKKLKPETKFFKSLLKNYLQ